VPKAHSDMERLEPAEPSRALDDQLSPPAVATLLGLAAPAVYAALRGGDRAPLVHHRTPGGQIRIRRREALRFCLRRGIAVTAALVPEPEAVLLLSVDSQNRARLARKLKPRARVLEHESLASALLAIGHFCPVLVLVDEPGFKAETLAALTELLAKSREHGCVGLLPVGCADDGLELTDIEGPLPFELRLGDMGATALGRLVGRLLGRP